MFTFNLPKYTKVQITEQKQIEIFVIYFLIKVIAYYNLGCSLH